MALPRPGAARDRGRLLGAARPAELPGRGELAARLDEREALERELAAEAAAREARQAFTLRDALTDRRILHCAAVYFTINFASYGTIFWFADIVERIGDIDGIELGLLAGIPMALGSAGLVVIARRSDRSGNRRRWVVIGMLLGAAGLAGTALLPPEAGVLTLAVCAFGLLGAIPAFGGGCRPRCSRAALPRAASP